MSNRPIRIALIAILLMLVAVCLLAALIPTPVDTPTEAATVSEENYQPCKVEEASATAAPQILTVQPNEKIQDAVDRAKPGDTVLIMPGTYKEAVSVNKNNITIRGQMDGNQRPILEGENKLGNGILGCGNNFVVENLQVQNYQANGLYVKDSESPIFRNNITINTGLYGIFPIHSKNVLIEKNISSGASDTGLYIGQSVGVIVRDNEAFANVSGIEIENSDNSLLENNYSHDNTAGLLVFANDSLSRKQTLNTKVSQNRFISNNLANFGTAGSTVANVPPGIGILVMNADGTKITQNEIRDNRSVGIALVSLRTFKPERHTFDVGTEPEGNTVQGNLLVHNGYDADPLAKQYGFPAVDLLWDGTGWNNTFDQAGATTFPPILPSSSTPAPLNTLYVRILSVVRRFL